jgi:hypothetical protein
MLGRTDGLVARLRRRVERAVEDEGERGGAAQVRRRPPLRAGGRPGPPGCPQRAVDPPDSELRPVVAATDPWAVQRYTENADATPNSIGETSVFDGGRPSRLEETDRDR